MHDSTLLIVASLGAFALLVSALFRRFVPEVVIFLALGLLIGPEGPLRLIHSGNVRSLELLTEVALSAIIFLIGDRLRFQRLRGSLRLLVPLNVVQIALTTGLVVVLTTWAGAASRTAWLLGLIAAESGVLTITATVNEQRARGTVTELLMSSVGVINVAVAILFGLAFPFILAGTGELEGGWETLWLLGRLVGASVVLGLVAGWVFVVRGRVIETSGELLLFLLVVLTAMTGVNILVGGSVVVSALLAGLYVANAAPDLADRLFAVIRLLEAPIYLVFFVVAGATIHVDELTEVGLVGAAYVLGRAAGKIGGSVVGGVLGGGLDEVPTAARVGGALLPHAGMAVALVALVVEQAPLLGGDVSAVVLGSIVLFELAGPLFTRYALRSAGETGGARAPAEPPELAGDRTFARVLIPIGSPAIVLPRLAFLLDLVGNLGADLVAVHVTRPGSLAREEGEMVLALVQQAATERGMTCETVHRVSESVARALVEVADSEEVDLIVMGEPARRSLLEPAAWGSVTQRVVRDVDVPVLVYPVDPSAPTSVPRSYRIAADARDA